MARSESHASILDPPRCPRTSPIELRGGGEFLFQGNHAFRGWDRNPVSLSDTPVAIDSTDLAAILHPCVPAIMAYAFSGFVGFFRRLVGSFV